MLDPAKVEVADGALADIARVVVFLAPRNPSASKRLRGAILQAFDAIGAAPGVGRPWQGTDPGTEMRERIVCLGRSAYIIRYAVEPDVVIILRVHHAREDR